ncbi:error-prone DNA polymerase [Xanthobacter variabilis]|uniref:error-prone DNA polymerase n=1 Tax=Xanthobacter variabilis TaxID=3119932 RepID=UPI00374E433B
MDSSPNRSAPPQVPAVGPVVRLPEHRAARHRSPPPSRPPEPDFVELAVTTNFSFLRGGSHPEEYVAAAQALGHRGIGIADRNTLAGVVRAHAKAKAQGFPLAVGARLVFADGTPDILAYPRDRAAYGRLCRLLTTGNMRAEKGDCILTLDDLLAWAEGLNLVVMPPRRLPRAFAPFLAGLRAAAGGWLWLAAPVTFRGDDARRLARLKALAAEAGLPLLATLDALYHDADRRPLQDVLTAIRHHVSLDEAGTRLAANGERHLKPAAEMARLYRALPEAVEESHVFFKSLNFSLDQLKPSYPREVREGFSSPQAALEALTWAGAAAHYPDGVPDKVIKALDHELDLIGRLSYAPYFLTVHEIVGFARGAGILCQGRGSAANSAVCFCLGITDVDPMRTELLFERFISEERGEPPDIDIDFEHERRGEVLSFIYRRYGAAHAGLTATTTTYRSRSAVREVGRAFGLSEDLVGALAGTIWGWSSGGVKAEEARRLGLDPDEPRLARVLELTKALIGFPRHLSQHVGGMVVTHERLDEIVPLTRSAMEERPIIEWNKDDIEVIGLLKVDILALGMLTAVKKCFGLLERHYGLEMTRIGDVPAEDERVYAMLKRADSIGVFQVESRAQQTMLPRLRPERFQDLVVEVAIVRPGPIQGGMVHPYLRRRQGLEPVDYPSPELREVLESTLGVPLFQEQAMRIAMVGAGFSAGEADALRRAMATFKRVGTIHTFHAKLITGMLQRGYTREFAESLWKQIEGFGSYGFPRSHAESFALIVYCSAWLKCHYPDVFAAGLMNAWPMGFYAPAQLVRDAREHGVEVRPVDVNASHWDHTLEPEAAPLPLPLPEHGGSLAARMAVERAAPRDGAPQPPTPPDVARGREALGMGAADGPGASARLNSRHGEMAGDIHSTHALRLGFRQVEGLRAEEMARLVARRGAGYDSVRDVWLRTGLPPSTLEKLADADAFRAFGLDRRAALWAVKGLRRSGDKDDLPLFRAASSPASPSPAAPFLEHEPEVDLPVLPPGAQVVADYRHMKLSLKAHPLAFLRPELRRRGVTPAADLPGMKSGQRLTLAGLVLVRQRPGTASGVIFMTLEDEAAWANVIVWPRVFEAFRPQVLGARLVMVRGKLQNEQSVIHLVAESVEDWSHLLEHLGEAGAAAPPDPRSVARNGGAPADADAPDRLTPHAPMPHAPMPREHPGSAMPKGRNFH